nr:hypothetical protein MACL_00002952 [Theileria orientalis]
MVGERCATSRYPSSAFQVVPVPYQCLNRVEGGASVVAVSYLCLLVGHVSSTFCMFS